MDKAIEILREARQVMAQEDRDYHILHYLQLPVYLQEAGQPGQALQAFRNLLDEYLLPHHRRPDQLHKNKALIFDKMRRFFEREKQVDVAAAFSILSAIARFQHEVMQGRVDIFRSDGSLRQEHDFVKEIRKITNRQLTKAGAEQMADAIHFLLQESMERAPEVDYKYLETELRNLLTLTEIHEKG